MAKKVRDQDSLSFKEATANMSGKEKVTYIWEYYRGIILGTIAGVLIVTSMVHAFVTQVDTYLHITFLSGFEHTLSSFGSFYPDEEDEPTDLYDMDLFPAPPPGIWVDFEVTSTLEALLLNDAHNYEIIVQHLSINFETIPVLTTHTGAGVLDIIVTYVPDFHAMVERDYFLRISDLGWDIPEHVMHNEYGIYLRYFPIFDDYIIGVDELVLGISASTRLIDNVENFFEILLD